MEEDEEEYEEDVVVIMELVVWIRRLFVTILESVRNLNVMIVTRAETKMGLATTTVCRGTNMWGVVMSIQ